MKTTYSYFPAYTHAQKPLGFSSPIFSSGLDTVSFSAQHKPKGITVIIPKGSKPSKQYVATMEKALNRIVTKDFPESVGGIIQQEGLNLRVAKEPQEILNGVNNLEALFYEGVVPEDWANSNMFVLEGIKEAKSCFEESKLNQETLLSNRTQAIEKICTEVGTPQVAGEILFDLLICDINPKANQGAYKVLRNKLILEVIRDVFFKENEVAAYLKNSRTIFVHEADKGQVNEAALLRHEVSHYVDELGSRLYKNKKNISEQEGFQNAVKKDLKMLAKKYPEFQLTPLGNGIYKAGELASFPDNELFDISYFLPIKMPWQKELDIDSAYDEAFAEAFSALHGGPVWDLQGEFATENLLPNTMEYIREGVLPLFDKHYG